jgi:CheY-like chemotaxis protein
VESEPGRGSTFRFEVALPVTEAAVQEEPTPLRNIIGYDGARRKVLVVDDKQYNRLLLVDLLEPLGFAVSTANDGQQAVDKTLELQPDAIVMDNVMPIKTGLEAVREIRQQPEFKDVVIIAASASVLEADQEESQVVGCDAFLPKPIKTEHLLDLLATYLELSWVYAEPEGEAEVITGALVPPPAEELAILHELARSGRMWDIRQHAARLAEMDAAYIPFADKLQALTKNFEIKKTTDFVEQFLETELVSPPKEELDILLDLARRGNMRAIQKRADHLEQTDERLAPFADKLRQLAKNIEDEHILTLITQCMGG